MSSKFNYDGILPRVWAHRHNNSNNNNNKYHSSSSSRPANNSVPCFDHVAPSTFIQELQRSSTIAKQQHQQFNTKFKLPTASHSSSASSFSSLMMMQRNKNMNSTLNMTQTQRQQSSTSSSLSLIPTGPIRRDREVDDGTEKGESDDHAESSSRRNEEFEFWSDLCSPLFFDIPEVKFDHNDNINNNTSNFPSNLLVAAFVSNPSFPCSNIPPLASAFVHSMRELHRRGGESTSDSASATAGGSLKPKRILYIISPSPKSAIMEELDQHVASNICEAYKVMAKRKNSNNSKFSALIQNAAPQSAARFIDGAVWEVVEIVSPPQNCDNTFQGESATSSTATWNIEHVCACIDLIKHKILLEQEKLFRALVEENLSSTCQNNNTNLPQTTLSFAVIIDQLDKFELSSFNSTNNSSTSSSSSAHPAASSNVATIAQHREARIYADIYRALRMREVHRKLMQTSNYFITDGVASLDDDGPLQYLYDFAKEKLKIEKGKRSHEKSDVRLPSAEKLVLDAVRGLRVLECSAVSCTGSCNYFYPAVAANASYNKNGQQSTDVPQQKFQQLAKQLVHSSVEWFSDRIMIS